MDRLTGDSTRQWKEDEVGEGVSTCADSVQEGN